MIQKGLSYSIPVTEEMRKAKEQTAAESELTPSELAAFEEGGKNPADDQE